jgi:hypothetical protein
MELELWYRWRLADRSAERPSNFTDLPTAPRPRNDLRRSLGRGLIRLGRLVGGAGVAPAAAVR